MAKKYLEMGLNNIAIKTIDIDHLRKYKIQSKAQKLKYRNNFIKN